MTLLFNTGNIFEGKAQLVPATTVFNGVPNEITGTNTSGLHDSSLWTPEPINRLVDVDTVTIPPVSGDILRYDGTNWVPSRERRYFNIFVYEPNIGAGNQNGFRAQNIPSINSRIRPPYPCVMANAVSSCQDNDDFTIQIYVNASLALTLTHPLNTTSLPHTPNLNLNDTDEIYIIFLRTGGGNVVDVVFDMYFEEII